MNEAGEEHTLQGRFILRDVRFGLRAVFKAITACAIMLAIILALVRGCPCLPRNRINAIKTGMTEDQVIQAMGREPYSGVRRSELRPGYSGNYYWTWNTIDPSGVLVVEFGPDGRVVNAFDE